MPFIPHTNTDVQEMLAEIGAASIDQLFDEIPEGMRAGALLEVPAGMSEMATLRWMGERAARDQVALCFAGAGSYDHHIPAAVWDITGRGEFMTAYTPYQAEASQGTLQLIYEYQSMMSELTGMDVSNASVYDGASGLGEAILMALRGNKKVKTRRVLMATSVHPHYAEAARNIVANQGIEIVDLPMDGPRVDIEALSRQGELDEAASVAAVVVQQPNFYGLLEQVDQITEWAHRRGALVVAVVNPMTLAVLKPPGHWGEQGADIACGDGQPLGIPMASGGPSFGFICCKRALVRQIPGRVIGRTEDLEGRVGYTLTLQAREQHIRRGKATSNICTNQGLLVTAATIYMSLLGPGGLRQVAHACHDNARRLAAALGAIDGVAARFNRPFFHEFVLDLPRPGDDVLDALLDEGILGGVALGGYDANMGNALLVCATEKHSGEDIQRYGAALHKVLR